MRVNKDAWLVSFDVESLYPNVPHVECVNACASAVSGSLRLKTMVSALLRFVLTNNVVTVQNRHYRQIRGGAMGTNCMPPAAQIYLAVCWEGEVRKQLGDKFPTVFLRYIDDGFVIFEGNEQELLSFINILNSFLPNIKITHSYSQFQIEMLDLVITKSVSDTWCGLSSDGKVRLTIRTHQKALNKYLYIPYTSFHHPGMFKSFVYAELMRYMITNTEKCWFESMVRKFVHRLKRRGYPLRFIEPIVAKVQHAQRLQYLSRTAVATPSDTGVLVLPYTQLIPELQPQRLLRDVYMSQPAELHAELPRPIVAFTRTKNLGSMLVKSYH